MIYSIQKQHGGRWLNVTFCIDKTDAEGSLEWHQSKFKGEQFRIAANRPK